MNNDRIYNINTGNAITNIVIGSILNIGKTQQNEQ